MPVAEQTKVKSPYRLQRGDYLPSLFGEYERIDPAHLQSSLERIGAPNAIEIQLINEVSFGARILQYRCFLHRELVGPYNDIKETLRRNRFEDRCVHASQELRRLMFKPYRAMFLVSFSKSRKASRVAINSAPASCPERAPPEFSEDRGAPDPQLIQCRYSVASLDLGQF